jgi:hypothetical protein
MDPPTDMELWRALRMVVEILLHIDNGLLDGYLANEQDGKEASDFYLMVDVGKAILYNQGTTFEFLFKGNCRNFWKNSKQVQASSFLLSSPLSQ